MTAYYQPETFTRAFVPTYDKAAVDAFIAQNGIRRFERGFRGCSEGLADFLMSHGYDVIRDGAHRRYTVKDRKTGDVKILHPQAFVAFVDSIRVQLGLEPVRKA